jgi:SAM-dependent methyltransferase
MSYSEITFNDKNTVKRFLQNHRLVVATKLVDHHITRYNCICDYGAGNGELCIHLHRQNPHSKIICYEPTSDLLEEARENLSKIYNIEFCQDVNQISESTIDIVYCLEVFEHLPIKETLDALEKIYKILKPGGTLIIGVPVEVGIPAFYKGIFRMSRRHGVFDTSPRNILLSLIGFPPKNRPIDEISPGFRFHYYHTGFDYRDFKKTLNTKFKLSNTSTSPMQIFGPLLMPEIYFVANKPNQ